MRLHAVVFSAVGVFACSAGQGADEASAESAAVTSIESMEASGGEATAESGESTESGAETGPPPHDMLQSCGSSCDIYWQGSCPEGQKCTAVACEVGSNTRDNHVCRDVIGSKIPGEECDSIDWLDGLDDCEAGSHCVQLDRVNEVSVCVEFCTGSSQVLQCPAGFSCMIVGDGIAPSCLADCDPLANTCAFGQLCLRFQSGEGFICTPRASNGPAPYGTPCEFANVCDDGLLCLDGSATPEPQCEGAPGCCSPVCDANLPNMCPGAGQVCQSLYAPGMEPEGYEHVGVCAVPM